MFIKLLWQVLCFFPTQNPTFRGITFSFPILVKQLKFQWYISQLSRLFQKSFLLHLRHWWFFLVVLKSSKMATIFQTFYTHFQPDLYDFVLVAFTLFRGLQITAGITVLPQERHCTVIGPLPPLAAVASSRRTLCVSGCCRCWSSDLEKLQRL